MGFLKSKPAKSTSVSENTNNSYLSSAYSPTINQGVSAGNFLQALLTGQGDVAGAKTGLQQYYDLAGYAPAMTQLSKNITGQAAAAGALGSGAYAKALQSRGAELNNSFLTNYLQQLLAQSGQGLQAGGLVANTGQKSTGTSIGAQPSSFSNIMQGIGQVGQTVGSLASVFSDRRLKQTIRKVGEFADGLGIYTFCYLGQKNRVRGVMADEVAVLRPWALGPRRAGYATVNYGAL